MKILCPNCQRDIPSDNVNVQTSLAQCRTCGEVFNFANQVPGAPAAGATKPPVMTPRGFEISHQLSDLVITRRWFSWTHIFMLFFCIFWDGFLVVWYTIGFRSHGPLMMLLFPLLHVAAGLFLTYTTLAGFVNRTEIRISDSQVSVRHYPLPWAGNKTIAAYTINQLFCEEKFSRSRNGGSSTTYTVWVCVEGGNRLKLVESLESPDHALYIEQQVEQRLHIADRPVAGEMRSI